MPISPFWTDMIKSRDEEARGKTMDQMARCGMFVHSGNPAPGHAPDRWSRFTWDEINRGQILQAMNHRLQVRERARPIRWIMGGVRLDVITHYPYMGDLLGFDPNWVVGVPIRLWENTLAQWRTEGWRWEWASNLSQFRPMVEEALAKKGLAPAPYFSVNPDTKSCVIYGYDTDARSDAFMDWIIDQALVIAKASGCYTFAHAFKSAVRETPTSLVHRPDGVHRVELMNGQPTWVRAPHDPNNSGHPLFTNYYAKGEYLSRFMLFTRRMRAAGFELMMNEAWPHMGQRWLWTDEYPEIEPMLIGEMQVRTLQ